MADKVLVLCSETGYRLSVNGEESEESAYGEPVEFEASSGIFGALVDTPEGKPESDEVESQFEHWAYKMVPVANVEVVDEGDEDESDEEGEEDHEDGEEDEDEPVEVK